MQYKKYILFLGLQDVIRIYIELQLLGITLVYIGIHLSYIHGNLGTWNGITNKIGMSAHICRYVYIYTDVSEVVNESQHGMIFIYIYVYMFMEDIYIYRYIIYTLGDKRIYYTYIYIYYIYLHIITGRSRPGF